jgi:GT2 family glycosyltransferase
MSGPSFSVVIPTYQRPDWIKRAVRSLVEQTRPPDEVIPVARDTDTPTHAAIDEVAGWKLPFALRRELVVAPGFMPPVERGLAVASGDIVAIMDDDAEAQEDWAARLIGHYANPRVGAVGGRYINTSAEGPTPVPTVDRVGYVTPLGQFVGDMYCQPTFSEPIEVDFMLGGNMSFRREIARKLEFDMELNRNVAQGYEIDVGLQVKNMGWKLLFDPLLAVRHYSAPRETVGLRKSDAEAIQWYTFNNTRVALRRLPWLRRAVSFAYQLSVGQRVAPGLLPAAFGPIGRRLGFQTELAGPALTGRMLAVRSILPNR